MYENMCLPKKQELNARKTSTYLTTSQTQNIQKTWRRPQYLMGLLTYVRIATRTSKKKDFEFSDRLDMIKENLNRFNITELTMSATSTALMENLTVLKNMGFIPVDLIQIEAGRTNWNYKTKTEEKEIKSAILLKKNEE